MKAIVNGGLIMEDAVLYDHAVIFEEKIIGVKKRDELQESDYEEVIDLKGRYLSAGFIDIHIHGCSGRDATDDDSDSIPIISQSLVSTGVTAFLPTTMTLELEKLEGALERIRAAMGGSNGAQVLGCHLEGPFINSAYKGAQSAPNISKPDFSLIRRYKDIIRIITMAPELEGAESFLEECAGNNIIVSMGHTGASYEEAMGAIRNGVKSCTHTFNAMTPLHHRSPGAVGAAMDTGINCELIADNIHVDPAVQRLLLKAKGIDNITLVTDAMRACLLHDGEYELGGQKVMVRNGEARLPQGNLAGSLLTLDRAVRNFMENTGISITDAVRTVTVNPAKLLRLENSKGSLKKGCDADFACFDEGLNISAAYIKGRKVYQRF